MKPSLRQFFSAAALIPAFTALAQSNDSASPAGEEFRLELLDSKPGWFVSHVAATKFDVTQRPPIRGFIAKVGAKGALIMFLSIFIINLSDSHFVSKWSAVIDASSLLVGVVLAVRALKSFEALIVLQKLDEVITVPQTSDLRGTMDL